MGSLRHVDAEFQTLLIDVRKPGDQKILLAMGDIEQDAIIPGLLQFGVDRLGDDIAGREALHGMVFLHEGGAVFQFQNRPLAANRFADQKGFCVGVVKTGRVKLDELHVGDLRPRPVGHGNPICRSDVGIRGDQIDLAGAAGG